MSYTVTCKAGHPVDGPDLSTLPQRMRWAADVVNEVTQRGCPNGFGEFDRYGHDELRSLANRWEAEDRAAAERDQLVEELARDIGHVVYMMTPDQRLNEMWLDQARALIEFGWHK